METVSTFGKAVARVMPERYRLSIYLSVYCGGLRIGEVCALQRRDIDLNRETLTVARERTTQGGQQVGPPKTENSRRTVDIPPQLMPLIRKHLDERVKPEPTAWLFPKARDEGSPVHPNTLRSHYAQARHAAGRDDMHFHDLRHTALTRLAQNGATVAELEHIAGHSDAQTAMHYQHAVSSHERQVIDRAASQASGDDGLRSMVENLSAEDRERLLRLLSRDDSKS